MNSKDQALNGRIADIKQFWEEHKCPVCRKALFNIRPVEFPNGAIRIDTICVNPQCDQPEYVMEQTPFNY